MDNRFFYSASLILTLLFLSGCDVIIDIFSAGFWTGIIVVVLLTAFGIWLIKKMK